ncbi:MAG: YchJ family protein [Thiobacillus sp.]
MRRDAACPCGSALEYSACCDRYHAGLLVPPDAEALMRARYSAYVHHMKSYLRATWHPDTCPAELGLDAVPRAQWLGLEVRAHRMLDNDHATVEFVARYKVNGRATRLHEISRFTRVDGLWCYIDGEQPG